MKIFQISKQNSSILVSKRVPESWKRRDLELSSPRPRGDLRKLLTLKDSSPPRIPRLPERPRLPAGHYERPLRHSEFLFRRWWTNNPRASQHPSTGYEVTSKRMNPPHKLRAEARARDPIIFREDRSLLGRENTRKIRSCSNRGLENRSSRDESLIRDVLSRLE